MHPVPATVIRRHPDVLHLKQPEDVARLAAVQENLLRAAVDMVKPGGTLVYCTCSLEPQEGSRRIAALLESGAPVERRPLDPAEPGAGRMGDARRRSAHAALPLRRV